MKEIAASSTLQGDKCCDGDSKALGAERRCLGRSGEGSDVGAGS